ncbi:hypothetical protein [Novosphingobium sp.]
MQLTPEQEVERKRIQRGRNRVMALVLGAMAILFFFISIAKMTH